MPQSRRAVHWYTRPGNNFGTKWGPAIGVWITPDTIVVAVEYLSTDWVLKHEMIHYLLQQPHSEAERIRIWGVRCHATWNYQPSDAGYRP